MVGLSQDALHGGERIARLRLSRRMCGRLRRPRLELAVEGLTGIERRRASRQVGTATSTAYSCRTTQACSLREEFIRRLFRTKRTLGPASFVKRRMSSVKRAAFMPPSYSMSRNVPRLLIAEIISVRARLTDRFGVSPGAGQVANILRHGDWPGHLIDIGRGAAQG